MKTIGKAMKAIGKTMNTIGTARKKHRKSNEPHRKRHVNHRTSKAAKSRNSNIMLPGLLQIKFLRNHDMAPSPLSFFPFTALTISFFNTCLKEKLVRAPSLKTPFLEAKEKLPYNFGVDLHIQNA